MKKTIEWIYSHPSAVLFILIVMMLAIITIFFSGCQFRPKQDEYKLTECFEKADCLYRAGKNNAICDKLAEACRDALKEERYYKRLTWCNNPDNILPAGWDAEKCRLYLNQK